MPLVVAIVVPRSWLPFCLEWQCAKRRYPLIVVQRCRHAKTRVIYTDATANARRFRTPVDRSRPTRAGSPRLRNALPAVGARTESISRPTEARRSSSACSWSFAALLTAYVAPPAAAPAATAAATAGAAAPPVATVMPAPASAATAAAVLVCSVRAWRASSVCIGRHRAGFRCRSRHWCGGFRHREIRAIEARCGQTLDCLLHLFGTCEDAAHLMQFADRRPLRRSSCLVCHCHSLP